jgi:hypothetical protein
VHVSRILPTAFYAACGALAVAHPSAAQDTLQPILNRIHQHAAAEEWKQPGWKDEAIENWLVNLTDVCAKAAKFPELKLPVRFADVAPGELAPDRGQQKTLLVGKNINLKNASLYNCIVLADGNVCVARAEGCVIIARGTVQLMKSEWSVIVAGVQVDLTTSDGKVGERQNGSLIATRGRAQMQGAYGTVLYTGEGATVSGPQLAVFINAAIVGNATTLSRSVRIKNFPIDDLPAHPFAERLKFVGLISTRPVETGRFASLQEGNAASPFYGVAFEFDDRRYVADVGEPILDEADQPVPALADWRLSYANDWLAVFSSDDADAVVRIEK